MTLQMSKRERLIAALNGNETDQLPWAPLIDGYFIRSLPEQGYHFEIIEAMRFIGNDILERHVAGPSLQTPDVLVKEEKSGNTTRISYETPVGTLFRESRVDGNTIFTCKPFIVTLEDVKTYQYIAEHTFFKANIEDYTKRDTFIGDDGLATLSGPASPVQELLQSVAGVENTVYLIADYPDEMNTLFASIHERNKRCYGVLAQYPCPVVFDYENTSTTVMSKSMFENHSVPAINDYAEIMHDAGKTFITHMCGKLSGFSSEIGKCRMDGVDSVCPPTAGDFFPWEARKAWSDKVIIGGIEPPSLYHMTAAETLSTVAEIIKKMPTTKSFILSTGDAVPYNTPIQNMIAVTKLISLLQEKSLSGDFDDEILHFCMKE